MNVAVERGLELLKSGRCFAWSAILASSGSTPRRKGSWMVTDSDGRAVGTVGGGILEASVIRESINVLNDKRGRILNVVLNGNDAAASGMICGGSARVLINYVDPDVEGTVDFFENLSDITNRNLPARIITYLPHDGTVPLRCQCIIDRDGALRGNTGFDEDVQKAVKESRNAYDVYTKLERWQVYVEETGTGGTAYIFGAGHCGEKLCPVLKPLGFRVVVIDDRSEFANEGRFPAADEILVPESYENIVAPLGIDKESYLIVVTRGHMHDETVLRQCLRTDAGYIGMIGSLPKRNAIYSHLLSDGYTQADIDRVHSPIGLPILAETPEEIAISIAAELIQVRASIKGSR